MTGYSRHRDRPATCTPVPAPVTGTRRCLPDDQSVHGAPAPFSNWTGPGRPAEPGNMNGQLVAAVTISVTVFGIGGFALGWFAGKRAYKDRLPAMDAEDLDAVDPHEADDE